MGVFLLFGDVDSEIKIQSCAGWHLTRGNAWAAAPTLVRDNTSELNLSIYLYYRQFAHSIQSRARCSIHFFMAYHVVI
jgi:hypothetical protein